MWVARESRPSTSSNLHPQSRHICAITDDRLNQGASAPINMTGTFQISPGSICHMDSHTEE
eukprot:5105144-Amphidinium_carterae.1